jgi:hypothetical protein
MKKALAYIAIAFALAAGIVGAAIVEPEAAFTSGCTVMMLKTLADVRKLPLATSSALVGSWFPRALIAPTTFTPWLSPP